VEALACVVIGKFEFGYGNGFCSVNTFFEAIEAGALRVIANGGVRACRLAQSHAATMPGQQNVPLRFGLGTPLPFTI
jgi:hypothetical protein